MPDTFANTTADNTTADLPKPWYLSRGVIGSIVAIVSGALGALGYGIPVEVEGQAVDLLVAAGGVIGGGVALWGRLRATRRIGQ